jgi:hypothetical protein
MRRLDHLNSFVRFVYSVCFVICFLILPEDVDHLLDAFSQLVDLLLRIVEGE